MHASTKERKAKEAIKEVFEDQSVTQSETRSILESLRDEIDLLLATLSAEG